MNLGFIGAGKVGTAFGIYLARKGFEIKGYYSRTYNSALSAARLTDSIPYKTMKDLCNNCEIIFITTNDDVISSVCERLIEEGALTAGQILVHMSGASSSKILEGARKEGCFIYSLHPLQAFADIEKAVEDLNSTVFSIEGDEEKIDVLEGILKTTGNHYFRLTSEQKSIYHATACVVSNYLVTLMDYGLSLFEAIGIDKMEGYKALYPLIEGTIRNIYKLGTEKALTGPIARGDVKTIQSHIESLRNIVPEQLSFYKLVGNMTLELAKREKLKDKGRIDDLNNILKNNDPNKKIFPTLISNLPEADINIEGLHAYLLQGENHQIIFMDFKKDVEIPEHFHEAQWGAVLDGEIELTVNDEVHTYKKGDTYYIPRNVKHSAKIKRGYKDITLFNQKDRYRKSNIK